MTNAHVTFPNHYTLALPPRTSTAIDQAKATYAVPLWQYRAERVLKLGGHQWIYPGEVATAYTIFASSIFWVLPNQWIADRIMTVIMQR